MIEETESWEVLKDLIRASLKTYFVWLLPISLGIVSYFGLQDMLSIIQTVLLFVLYFIFALCFIMIYFAIREIKKKNEKIIPNVSEIFEREPKDVIIEDYQQTVDIKNLNGDCNITACEKLARLSGKKIHHWLVYVGNSKIPEYLNIKAYQIHNGTTLTNSPLNVEPILKQKNLQVFRIDFLPSKQIEFEIKYSLNHIFPEMLTVGEWINMEFTRQLERYKFEAILPNDVQKIEKCCITKKASSGPIIESGCYSTDNRDDLVPLQETCFPPASQIESELNISSNSGGRKTISLESQSALDEDDSVRIWWLCSKNP